MIPSWFLYISGFSLMILGAAQIQARPRKKNAGFYERFVNVGTVWSLCCVAAGAAVVAMALGWWQPWVVTPRRP